MKYLKFEATKGYHNHLDNFVYVGDGDVLIVDDKKAAESENAIAEKLVSREHADALVRDYPNNFIPYNEHPDKAKAKQPVRKEEEPKEEKQVEEGSTKQVTESKKTAGRKK